MYKAKWVQWALLGGMSDKSNGCSWLYKPQLEHVFLPDGLWIGRLLLSYNGGPHPVLSKYQGAGIALGLPSILLQGSLLLANSCPNGRRARWASQHGNVSPCWRKDGEPLEREGGRNSPHGAISAFAQTILHLWGKTKRAGLNFTAVTEPKAMHVGSTGWQAAGYLGRRSIRQEAQANSENLRRGQGTAAKPFKIMNIV